MIADWSNIQYPALGDSDQRGSSLAIRWMTSYFASESAIANVFGRIGWRVLQVGDVNVEADYGNICYPEDQVLGCAVYLSDAGAVASLTSENVRVVADRVAWSTATCNVHAVNQVGSERLTFMNSATGKNESIPWNGASNE